MAKYKKSDLTRKQRDVLDDMFSGAMSEEEVLERHKVSRLVYQRWLCQEKFAGQFSFCIDSARRQGRMIVARFIPVAAAKLVELTGSEKEETARKSCLDIMSMPFGDDKVSEVATVEDERLSEGLNADLAEKLLKSLAEGDQDGGE